MRLHEYEAADIFYKEGIAVPRRGVAETTEEALETASRRDYHGRCRPPGIFTGCHQRG